MVYSVRVRGAYQLITDTNTVAEPKTFFRNKTKHIIYLVTSIDNISNTTKLFANTNDLHDTNV